MSDTEQLDEVCTSCAERLPGGECPESKRACGHHCNHSWSHDECCWCGTEFGGDPEDADTERAPAAGGQEAGQEIAAEIDRLLEADRASTDESDVRHLLLRAASVLRLAAPQQPQPSGTEGEREAALREALERLGQSVFHARHMLKQQCATGEANNLRDSMAAVRDALAAAPLAQPAAPPLSEQDAEDEAWLEGEARANDSHAEWLSQHPHVRGEPSFYRGIATRWRRLAARLRSQAAELDRLRGNCDALLAAARGEGVAVRISEYLHSLKPDDLQPLVWHMARGLSERLAVVVTEARSATGAGEQGQ